MPPQMHTHMCPFCGQEGEVGLRETEHLLLKLFTVYVKAQAWRPIYLERKHTKNKGD